MDRRARMVARMPSLPPERLEQWSSRLLQYAVLPKFWLLNNCAIYENLVFDNTVNYVEYRVYGDPANPMAPFVQNFSDRNMFWARDTNQVLFAGPADYVYTNGLAGWQAAANRDLESVVADPLDPKTKLPEWAGQHAFLKEPRRRLNTDLAAAGLNRVARFMMDPRDGRSDADWFDVVAGEQGVFGCVGLMACADVCPKELPLATQIAFLRRRMVCTS